MQRFILASTAACALGGLVAAGVDVASTSQARAGLVLGGTSSAPSCPAATFNGTSSFASAPLTFSSVSHFSISLWANIPSFNSSDELLLEYSPNVGTNSRSFVLDPNSSTYTGLFESDFNQSGVISGASFPLPSAAAWHNLVFVYDLTVTGATPELVGAYIDGTSQTITFRTGTVSADTIGNYTLYIMSRAGTTRFQAGSMGRLAIWTSGLSSANATSLAGGAAPSTVAGGPVFYWALTGTSGTEANLGSGGTAVVTLTSTGTGAGPSSCPTL